MKTGKKALVLMMTSVLSFSTLLTPAFASSENEITAGSEPAIVLESQEEHKAEEAQETVEEPDSEEAQEAVAEPYQKEPSETVAEPDSEEIPVAEESLKNDEDPESSEEDSLDAMVSSGREVTEEADKKEELEAESQDVALTGITEEFTLQYGESTLVTTFEVSTSQFQRSVISEGAEYAKLEIVDDPWSGYHGGPDEIPKVTNVNKTGEWQDVTLRFDYGALYYGSYYYYFHMAPEYHSVTYKVCEPGSATFEQKYKEDNIAHLHAADPSKVGVGRYKDYNGTTYKFFGWYTDETCAVEADLNSITQNTTVYGKYARDGRFVIYDRNDGSDLIIKEVGVGNTVLVDNAEQEEELVLDSWNTKPNGLGTAYKPGDTFIMPDENVFLTAQWIRDTYYTVTFDTGGHGTAPESQSIQQGRKATEPDDPANVEEGDTKYEFYDWYEDEELKNRFDFDLPITEDTTIYARWRSGTLIRKINNLTVTPATLECGYDFSVRPVFSTTDEGLSVSEYMNLWVDLEAGKAYMEGTAEGGKTYTAITMIDGPSDSAFSDNLELPAGFSVANTTSNKITVVYDFTAEHKWGEPTYEWSDDSSTVTATRICDADPSHVETETVETSVEVTEATEDTNATITYRAVFENEAFEEQVRTKEKIDIGGTSGESTDPCKEEHQWGEWSVTKEPTTSEEGEMQRVCLNDPSHVEKKPIEKLKTFSISYDLNGGTLDGRTGIITIEAAEGSTITLPAPVREGYTFDHWKGSEYKAGESYKVKEDHTFTAQWKANAPSGGGSSRGSNSVNTGDQSGLMMWFGLMTGSLLAIFAVLFLRKREMK